jgi:hypothetical protein
MTRHTDEHVEWQHDDLNLIMKRASLAASWGANLQGR